MEQEIWKEKYRKQRIEESETWKDIPWYEWVYQASSLGNIKSINYNHTWKEKNLKLLNSSQWYLKINLYKNWKKKTLLIHRLIAQTFILNLDNKPQVNHINWIKGDNRIKNLEHCTSNENIRHKFDILWYKNPSWKDNFWAKRVNQYDLNWNFIKLWLCMMDIERELWIDSWNIWKICRWKYKSAWWFKWEYR